MRSLQPGKSERTKVILVIKLVEDKVRKINPQIPEALEGQIETLSPKGNI